MELPIGQMCGPCGSCSTNPDIMTNQDTDIVMEGSAGTNAASPITLNTTAETSNAASPELKPETKPKKLSKEEKAAQKAATRTLRSAAKSTDGGKKNRKALKPDALSPSKPGSKRNRKIMDAAGGVVKTMRVGEKSPTSRLEVSETPEDSSFYLEVDAFSGSESSDSVASSRDELTEVVGRALKDSIYAKKPAIEGPEDVDMEEAPVDNKKRKEKTPAQKEAKTERRRKSRAEGKLKKQVTKELERTSLNPSDAVGKHRVSKPLSEQSSRAELKDLKKKPSNQKIMAVTTFNLAMGNGKFLIAARSNEGTPKLTPMEFLAFWTEGRQLRDATGTGPMGLNMNPLPALTQVLTYGGDLAIEFGTVEDATTVDGTTVPCSAPGQSYVCRRNRHLTTRVYSIRKTGLVSQAEIVETAEEAWPSESFKLYRHTHQSVDFDDWGIEFVAPPRMIVKELVFKSTNTG